MNVGVLVPEILSAVIIFDKLHLDIAEYYVYTVVVCLGHGACVLHTMAYQDGGPNSPI